MDVLNFDIPYPPSINHYYLRTSSGVMIGAKGKTYRRDIGFILHRHRETFTPDKRLMLTMHVFPPDKRRRDIDNILKCAIDSLQHARIFEDDNQIDMLIIVRKEVVRDGKLSVWLSECY